jgi:subtilisin family serine protease
MRLPRPLSALTSANKHSIAAFLVFTAVFGASAALHSGPADAARTQAAVQAKIDPRLLSGVSSGVTREFTLLLTDQADLSPAYTLPTRSEKVQYVYSALTGAANRSQAPVQAELSGMGLKSTGFFVTNAFTVAAPVNRVLRSADLYRLAARADVAWLEPSVGGLLNQVSSTGVAAKSNTPLGIKKTKAAFAWKAGFKGQGIVIGVLDSGANGAHPTLVNQYRGKSAAGVDHNFNWFDTTDFAPGEPFGASRTPAPEDAAGHGSHVTGTAVGGAGRNKIGVAPGAKWMHVRAFFGNSSTDTALLGAMQWMLAPTDLKGQNPKPESAPDIMNNSWGTSANSEAFKRAFLSIDAAGTIVVAAAGNKGPACNSLNTQPAGLPFAVTVGGLDARANLIGKYSSRGPGSDPTAPQKPNVVAPGERVLSAAKTGRGFTLMTGTSMATPHVSGAIALLWSAEPALKNKPAETLARLQLNAVHVAASDCSSPRTVPNFVYGFGKLDCKRLIKNIQ